jgi:hypothetical protein
MKPEQFVELCLNYVIGVYVFNVKEDHRMMVQLLLSNNFVKIDSDGFIRRGDNSPQRILLEEEIRVGKEVGKLELVKMYKERTGKSLMDSKNTVEKYFADQGLQFYKHVY